MHQLSLGYEPLVFTQAPPQQTHYNMARQYFTSCLWFPQFPPWHFPLPVEGGDTQLPCKHKQCWMGVNFHLENFDQWNMGGATKFFFLPPPLDKLFWAEVLVNGTLASWKTVSWDQAFNYTWYQAVASSVTYPVFIFCLFCLTSLFPTFFPSCCIPLIWLEYKPIEILIHHWLDLNNTITFWYLYFFPPVSLCPTCMKALCKYTL